MSKASYNHDGIYKTLAKKARSKLVKDLYQIKDTK